MNEVPSHRAKMPRCVLPVGCMRPTLHSAEGPTHSLQVKPTTHQRRLQPTLAFYLTISYPKLTGDLLPQAHHSAVQAYQVTIPVCQCKWFHHPGNTKR